MRLSDPAGPPPRVAMRAGFLGAMLAALLHVLLAVPLAPAARASARHRAAGSGAPSSPARSAAAALAPCEPFAGPAPEERPVLRSAVGLNYAAEEFKRARDGTIEVCVLVDSTGTVSEARVVRALPPFDSAAVEAARWWVFAPARDHSRPVRARVAVTLEARVPRDAEPLSPDVVALARDAEARGDLRGALDAWTGALSGSASCASPPACPSRPRCRRPPRRARSARTS